MIKNRLLAIFVASILISAPSFSQNKTRIGAEHSVSFGAGYGYASSPVANFSGVFIDFNAANSNLRTRVGFNLDNVGPICGSGLINLQYLLRLAEGIYFYPFGGAKVEYHDAPALWDKQTCFAPQAGLGLEFQFSSHFGFYAQGAYEYAVAGDCSRIFGQTGLVFAFGPGRRGVKKAAPAPKTATIKTFSAAEVQARAAAKAAEVEASIARTKAEAAARAAASMAPKSVKAASGVKAVSPDSTYKVNFMTNTTFVNQDGRAVVDLLIAYLMGHPGKKIEIVVYADMDTVAADGGIGLAQKRVSVVKSFFTVEGIDPSRIDTRAAASAENPSPSPEGTPQAQITIK